MSRLIDLQANKSNEEDVMGSEEPNEVSFVNKFIASPMIHLQADSSDQEDVASTSELPELRLDKVKLINRITQSPPIRP